MVHTSPTLNAIAFSLSFLLSPENVLLFCDFPLLPLSSPLHSYSWAQINLIAVLLHCVKLIERNNQ